MTIQPSLAEMLKPREKGLLRFLTCGSVDDGKSTLIGRLLYDSKLIFEDSWRRSRRIRKPPRHDRRGHRLRAARRRARGRARAGHHHRRRLSLLLDGEALLHRRRHARPRAVHPQHGDRRLRRADLAVMLIDARKGVLVQTKRHATSARCSAFATSSSPSTRSTLLGYDKEVFDRIVGDYRRLRRQSRLLRRSCRSRSPPASATMSPRRSGNTPGITGPASLEHLETVEIDSDARQTSRSAFRCSGSTGPTSISAALPAPSPRGRSGPAMPSPSPRPGRTSTRRPHRHRRTAISPRRVAGDAVTLTLADEVDVARGDVLVAADRAARGRRPVRRPRDLDGARRRCCPGRSYLMRDRHQGRAGARSPRIKHKIDVNTQDQLAATTLALNEIGFCNVSTGAADRLRRLSRQSRDRRLHPDRPLHQPHGRRRHDRLRPAPRHQHPLAVAVGRQGGARR